jgi:isocitrate dehydrogenase kinase/phosphatase
VEGRVETVMKDKNEVKERAMQALKEKDEVKIMAQKTQVVIQNLYKEILDVPIVVEATMEEHVLKISESIKGFNTKIKDL